MFGGVQWPVVITDTERKKSFGGGDGQGRESGVTGGEEMATQACSRKVAVVCIW